MAKPARNLASALDDAPTVRAEPTAAAPAEAPPKPGVPKSRAGKSLVGGHLPDSYRRTLRMISAEEDVTVEALLQEALDMLFRKKGVSR